MVRRNCDMHAHDPDRHRVSRRNVPQYRVFDLKPSLQLLRSACHSRNRRSWQMRAEHAATHADVTSARIAGAAS